MRKSWLIITALFGSALAATGHAASAQAQTAAAARLRELDFLVGEWSGSGAFASGKPIEADASFASDADGHILVYRHLDRPPNKYKATSVWRYDAGTQQFVADLYDNFGGVRRFTAPAGAAGQVVFEQQAAPGSAAAPSSRFRYEKLTDTSFKMTYEVDRRDGRGWQLGDYLVFTKK